MAETEGDSRMCSCMRDQPSKGSLMSPSDPELNYGRFSLNNIFLFM